MLLDMFIIADRLKECDKCHLSQNYQRTLRGVRLYNPNRRPDWADYVYLVTKEQMSDSRNNSWNSSYMKKQVIFINTDPPSEDFWQDEDYICIKTTRAAEEILEEIQNIFDWYNEWERKLLQAKIVNADLQEIMNIAAKAFPNPIAVFDNSTRLLAWAGEMPQKRDALWDIVLSENVAYISEMNHLFKEKNIFEDVENGRRAAFYILNDEKWPDTLQANIYDPDTGIRLGNFGATKLNAPLTDGQLGIMDYLTDYMVSVLINYNHSVNNARQQILLNALEGKSISKDFFQIQVFGYSDINLSSARILALKPRKEEQFTEIELKAILTKIQRTYMQPGCLTVLYQKQIVIFAANTVEEKVTEAWKEILSAQYKEFALGISDGFTDIDQIPYAYKQASIAADYSLKDSRKSYHYFRNDLYKYAADQISRELPMKAVCHPKIYEIYQYDISHGTQNLQTLRSYLECSCNISQAALDLYIHRNTMVYRLDKLKELFGEKLFTDYKTGELLFSINLIMQ